MMTRPSWTRDPAAASLSLFCAVGVLGFVAIGLGWRVAARTLFVASQVPALISGGLAGVALVIVGCAFVTIQAERRLAAQERSHTDTVLDEAAALVTALKSKGAS